MPSERDRDLECDLPFRKVPQSARVTELEVDSEDVSDTDITSSERSAPGILESFIIVARCALLFPDRVLALVIADRILTRMFSCVSDRSL